MSYVASQLLPGERIQYRAHLHKIIFLLPVVLCLLTAVFLVLAFGIDGLRGAALVLAALALALLGWTVIVYRSSEFAVTDRRVIIKVGWLRRRTVETMLGKVEGVGVNQDLPGRILNFGTITVTGTGGTMEEFHRIANPLQFRKQIQGQVIAAEERRKSAGPDPEAAGRSLTAAATEREERECPFCAERILRRAKICRFCGRDVAVPGQAGEG